MVYYPMCFTRVSSGLPQVFAIQTLYVETNVFYHTYVHIINILVFTYTTVCIVLTI